MATLIEVLDKTAAFFAQKGLEKPRLQAELLFARALGCGRLQLFLQFDKPMTDDILDRVRPWVRRRAQREPLQYILGDTPFCDLKLKTDARALIPRPETEQLVEEIQKRLKDAPPTTILDLGTGTGAIALALAQIWKEASVSGTDVSADALALAQENAAANSLEHVQFIESSWFEKVSGQFNLIVSNPPYLTQEELASAEPEVREHEPHSALVADDDGLADLKIIIRESFNHLNEGGMLALETGIAQHPALATLATERGFTRTESVQDLSLRDRFFFCWR